MSTKLPRVLLADDDVELCSLIAKYLTTEGFELDTVHDGAVALERLQKVVYDLVMLDVMMPRKSGLDVLRELRKTHQTPVLILTARGDDVDHIVGLELGADDYVAKPCNPRVLTARIRAVLRRNSDDASKVWSFEVGNMALHTGNRTAYYRGERVPLTSTEFSLLEKLITSAGAAVSKDELSIHALGRAFDRADRSIDMHMSNLRQKIGKFPEGGEQIKTIHGIGFQFVVDSK